MSGGPDVSVTAEGDGSYRVVVSASLTTTHLVRVPAGMAARLGWSEAEADLVRESFSFLLEREAPSSILRQFDLDVIGQYFPEYDGEIRRHPEPGTPL